MHPPPLTLPQSTPGLTTGRCAVRLQYLIAWHLVTCTALKNGSSCSHSDSDKKLLGHPFHAAGCERRLSTLVDPHPCAGCMGDSQKTGVHQTRLQIARNILSFTQAINKCLCSANDEHKSLFFMCAAHLGGVWKMAEQLCQCHDG